MSAHPLVEAVARAIARHDDRNNFVPVSLAWSGLDHEMQDIYRNRARAAALATLKALRDGALPGTDDSVADLLGLMGCGDMSDEMPRIRAAFCDAAIAEIGCPDA